MNVGVDVRHPAFAGGASRFAGSTRATGMARAPTKSGSVGLRIVLRVQPPQGLAAPV